MARMTRAQEIETAKRLIRSPRQRGDHGFTDAGLVAWKTQRSAMGVFLWGMVSTYYKPSLTAIGGVFAQTCPKMVQSDAGTRGGETWTKEVREFAQAVLAQRGLRP